MTVIRDAVIRIRTEKKFESRAFEQEKKAADEAAKSMQGLSTAYTEAGRSSREFSNESRISLEMARAATRDFSHTSINSFRESGEGVLRFSRGLAFMAASGDQDLRKLIQTVSLAQGAFDIFAGGAKAISSLGAAFGPPGVAVGAVTVALGAGAVAWSKWRAEAEQAKQVALEASEAMRQLRDERGAREREAGAQGQTLNREILARRTGASFSPSETQKRLESEQAALRGRLREMHAADQARIDQEREFRPEFNRPVRGTPARRARIAARREAELAAPVGPEGYDQAGIAATERKDIAERMLQIEREMFQIKQQELQQQRQATIEDGAGGIFGFSSSSQRSLNRKMADQTFDSQNAENVARHQKAADSIVQIWEAAAQQMREITNANN